MQEYSLKRIYFVVLLISLLWIAVSYFTISARIDTLTSVKYDEISYDIQKKVEELIDQKQEMLSLFSMALSYNNEVKEALITNSGSTLDLAEYSKRFSSYTHLKGCWIQVIGAEGKSLYRSWTSKKGDNLKGVRLEVAEMIKKPTPMNTISVGKYTLSFKSMVPVFDEGQFIGMLEVISDFNSLATQTNESHFETVVLIDKAYTSQLELTTSANRIEGYQVANTNASEDSVRYLKEKGITSFLSTTKYTLDENNKKLVAILELNDLNHKPMGYLVSIYDTNMMDLENINHIKQSLIIMDVIVFLFLLASLYFLYIKRYKAFMTTLNQKLSDTITEKTKELEEQNDKLNHHMYYDALTNLPNRHLFLDRLEHAIKLAKHHNTKVCVLFVDLDRFKEVNDTYGHDLGDKLLVEVSHRLTRMVGRYDTLSRLGGDEFAVIIEESQSDKVANVIQSIMDHSKDPIIINETILYTTYSIGISSFPQDGTTTEILLRNADTAMYRAKDHGRNTYAFYNQTMSLQAFKRVQIETDLRNAMRRGGFEVYYQPKMNAVTQKVVGLEALIRWNHPELGMVSPADFIPLAEEVGLITKLDRWMMQDAMTTVSAWQKQGINTGKLSVNLSIKDIEEEAFLSFLQQVLSKNAFNPELLELEVTESQIMRNPQFVHEALSQARIIGVSISIDDFGTGHSSLASLKSLPIDQLKIDKSFIQDLPADEESVAIVKTIIALAQNLKLNVIAEGVETVEQKDFLVEAGCHAIQGYYYSKPLPAHECYDFLLKYA